VRSLDTLFGIAERRGCGLDIHLHEPVLRYNLRRDDELDVALDCVTHAGARGCGFAAYGLAPGDRADLVLVDAQTVAEAIVARPPRRLVVAGGRIAARHGSLI
jgi:cytosine deaminase